MTTGPGGGVFHLTLEAPFGDGGWTDVLTTVFVQPRFDYLVEPEPFLAGQLLPIADGHVQLDIPTGHDVWFQDIYHLEARLIERDGAGTILRQGPGYTAMVGLSEPILALWEIEGIPPGSDFHGVVFPVPIAFRFPWASFKGQLASGFHLGGSGSTSTVGLPRFGGGHAPAPGHSPLPGLDPSPTGGTPNPRFDGHTVHYRYDPLLGTWGGGSGCLPDIPDFPTDDPPIGQFEF
jgi:hypothetical protein